MSRFLSDRFSDIEPYTPGEQPKNTNLVKLNTNESPFPPSERVIRALNAAEISRLNLYSDPETKEVIAAIAEVLNVKPDQIMMGNGSDEILAFAFQAFCDKEHPPCFADITYGFYPVFCRLFGLNPEIIPLKDDLTIDPADYCDKNKPIFIANPNAPTGLTLSICEIKNILDTNRDTIVLIDEAYVDFGGQSAIPLINEYDNLIVCRTFSKSRNLAGARLGFAVSNSSVIEDLNKMKFSFNPYNINRLSIIAGKESILDTEYFEECIIKIKENREYTVNELTKRGFSIPESKANFIFAKPCGITGTEFYKKLREKNILVRHFDTERIKDYVRITIGSYEQMQTLINATDEILGR
ncbi:MAG: histidinol-phosphate transaminase [Clostridiales bacterium]|nr:histidinol-phosphate transaminase [Clostridiales bacterium]